MTGRATFGELVSAARAQLRLAAIPPPALARGYPPQTPRAGQVREFTRGMHRLVTVMTWYAADITATLAPAASTRPNLSWAWSHTSLQAQQAIQNAAAFLQPPPADAGRPGDLQVTPAAGPLDAAAALLAAGHDLLHTHHATLPDGTRLDRSEWAPVVTSPPVTRALLLELGLWARRAAAQGARIALPGPAAWHGSGEERNQLNIACQWLWVLDSAVQAAQRHHPVTIAEVGLLHAIPVNARAPRRIPGATQTITSLCQGTIDSAERIRHAAAILVPDPVFSPALTAESLSHAAACGTVISHNCEIVLRGLAVRAGQLRSGGLAAGLTGCADAAAQARAGWLDAARAWQRMATDTRGTIAPAAAECSDLALWTGRLAYTDPSWTPALGPAHPTRSADTLAPDPADLSGVVAAVHEAFHTLSRLAEADHRQIAAAAQAGRLLVPTRSLPDRFDIPAPFAPAPQDRIDGLLTAYHGAAARSAQATSAIATIAADLRAPSHLLTIAQAATSGGRPAQDIGRQPAEQADGPQLAPEFPGPVERLLHDLGVTSPATLARAATIDQLAEHLILDATRTLEPEQTDLETTGLSRSTGTAELINHMLATGSPRASAILHPPIPPASQTAGQVSDRTVAHTEHTGHQRDQAPEAEAEP